MTTVSLFKVDSKLSLENNTLLNPASAGEIEIKFLPNDYYDSWVILSDFFKAYGVYPNEPNATIENLSDFDFLNTLWGTVVQIKISSSNIQFTIEGVENGTINFSSIGIYLINFTGFVAISDFKIKVKVPSINPYLNSLSVKENLIVSLSPAWIKNINNITNKINIKLEGRMPLQEYNYMRIRQYDFDYYFFIVGYTEKGANQVDYDLRLDTLNTYASNSVHGVDLEDSSSLILREHKDRFSNNTPTPIYNKMIEDIDIPIRESSQIKKWNVDRTRLVLQEFGGDVSGGTILSDPLYFWEVFTTTSKTIGASPLLSNYQLGFGWGMHSNVAFSVSLGPLTGVVNFFPLPTNYKLKFCFLINTPAIVLVDRYGNLVDIDTYIDTVYEPLPADYTVQTIPSVNILVYNQPDIKGLKPRIVSATNQVTIYYNMGRTHDTLHPSYRIFGYLHKGKTKPISLIDPQSARNMKIIEIPYFIVGATAKLAVGTDTASYMPILANIQMNVESNQSYFEINKPTKTFTFGATETTLKIANNDPKIYMSQFNPYLLTWYNESMPIKIESFNQKIKFLVGLSVSDYSKVRLEKDLTNDYLEDQPFEMTRTIDLNNEVATMSGDLKEYIEKLYQNDLKLMQLQQAQSNRNLAKQGLMGLGAVIIGGALTVATGGAAAPVVMAGAVALANFGFAAKSATEEQKRRVTDYNNKLIAMQNSLVNIAGGSPELNHNNDIDAIRLFETKPIASDIAYLDNYFHKFGYQSLDYKKMTIRTREKFDYKQVIFEELKINKNLTVEVKKDIIERFSQGVTIYHEVLAIPERFDFEQKYENREVALI